MAGVDTTALMNCSYGAAGFILNKLTCRDDARLVAGQGRIGTDLVFEGEGFIDDTVPANFYGKLAAVQAAMSTDGQNFAVTGPVGTQMFSLGAGACLDGGPQCSFTIEDGLSPMHAIVKFTLKARLNTPLGQTFKFETVTHPDGRQTFHQSGTFSGATASAAYATVLAQFKAAYGHPNWVVNFQFTENSPGTQIEYSFSADQCITPLPAASATTYAVEGETTFKQEIDEQRKLMQTWEFDYLIVGNPVTFFNSLLATFASVPLIRYGYSTTYVKGYRMKASFTSVSSADGAAFVFWQQTVRVAEDQAQYEEAVYPGASPLAILKPQSLGRMSQTGSAVAIGSFASAPAPIMALLSKLPEVGYESMDALQNRTSWNYEGFAVDASGGQTSFNPLALRP